MGGLFDAARERFFEPPDDQGAELRGVVCSLNDGQALLTFIVGGRTPGRAFLRLSRNGLPIRAEACASPAVSSGTPHTREAFRAALHL